MSIQERIKQARTEKGLTLQELGDIVGVTPQSVAQWEKYAIPRPQKIKSLADALGVSPEWLQFGTVINQNSTIGTQNNVSGDQNTNNFFGEETTEKEDKAILGDDEAKFQTGTPIFGIDNAVEYALNPKKGERLKENIQRVETFIPHSDMTFGVKIADAILIGIAPAPIIQNDILIIEPRIPPRNQDLVLVCLDYQQPMQRGMFARLFVDLRGEITIKYSEQAAESLPPNALICGVVVSIERPTLPADLVSSRIDVEWDILNTLNRNSENVS
ncbi:helix-turn-helix domain-containing protein [Wielerella bovis]|uniref:helix-turn-helix domain-containing protein n=1 Tax=Wielerella bovis TaxID=2917790 RepID=UPI00201A13A7|nr:helix-turn-helix transcriptional regulator [Wielerella bovis]ULJ68157.1 helix-turn-helix domain-containing protein [Wielerella bovis]